MIWIFYSICLIVTTALNALPVEIEMNTECPSAPVKILLAVVPATDKELVECAHICADVLQYSGQTSVKVQTFDCPKSKKEIKYLFDQGYSLALFVNQADNNSAIEWRLYDTNEAVMITGKKMYKHGTVKRGYAYSLADDIWPELTNQKGCFCSKIAYTKRVTNTVGKQKSIICIADFDGSHEQELYAVPGSYVGLYWHNKKDEPALLCSECARFNVRFISLGLDGRKQVIFNFDGTCVGISLDPETNSAVYCRSGSIWRYTYDDILKKGIHKRIIYNKGKNTGPIILPSGDIIFCSDASSIIKKITGPQICYYKHDSGAIELITDGGYCVGPAYNATVNKIAYCKRINNSMQLCVYDIASKKHTQLTFDAGNKIDCTWSACGNYIMYCYQKNNMSRIAVFHVARNKNIFLTDAEKYCTSPAWSRVYAVLPMVKKA